MSLVIGYCSDMHLEVVPGTALDRISCLAQHLRGVDVLVVAGDFSSDLTHRTGSRLNPHPLTTRIMHLCDVVAPTEVVYVPGNHEYYHTSFQAIDRQLRELNATIPNLHVLNNEVTILKGQRFVGTTLWFPHREYDVDLRLNDFNQIENFSPLVEIRGRAASNFLAQVMQEGDVVVTHHLPTRKCVDDYHAGNPTNKFYVHNHAPLLEEVKPALWFHGHSHTSLDMKVGETRFLRNPYGYENYEVNPDFNFGAYVEVN